MFLKRQQGLLCSRSRKGNEVDVVRFYKTALRHKGHIYPESDGQTDGYLKSPFSVEFQFRLFAQHRRRCVPSMYWTLPNNKCKKACDPNWKETKGYFSPTKKLTAYCRLLADDTSYRIYQSSARIHQPIDQFSTKIQRITH